MNVFLRILSCAVVLTLILAMPLPGYAEQPNNNFQKTMLGMVESITLADSEQEINARQDSLTNTYRIVENPVIVDDGRQFHHLTDEVLSSDTLTLLRAVLNSEYINIARASARLLSSSFAPLEVHYSEFNGYLELLTREDIGPVLLDYIEKASVEELLILDEMLRRSDM